MLATRSGGAFHLSEAWVACWADAFGPVRRAGGLALIDASERIGPWRLRTLRSATNPHTLRFDIAEDAPVAADLPEQLFAACPGAASIRLDYLPADARLLGPVASWRERFRVRLAAHAVAPVVDCRDSFEAWLSRRSKRIRQRLRQSSRSIFTERGMRLEFRRDDPLDSGLFPRMLAVEQSGWKGRGGTAILDDPAIARFYSALAREAARADALRCAMLWDGERLVAFELGVLCERRLFLPKVGYDEGYADLSPGYVLAAEHIRHACEDPGIDWYDKMGNGLSPASYKLRYADQCDPLYRLTLYAPGVAGTALYLRDAARARAKRWRDARRAGAAA